MPQRNQKETGELKPHLRVTRLYVQNENQNPHHNYPSFQKKNCEIEESVESVWQSDFFAERLQPQIAL